ncbi:MAG TPA: hypothetical protein PKC43_00420 [Phycisphaerales bacterium]|nr:hypothetical protein [Phycisphaerales bacterium]HMP35889.1 hypothetical protein [Phycisphaerales bacterium]
MTFVDCQAAARNVRSILSRGSAERGEILPALQRWNEAVASVAERLARCRPWLDRGLVAEAVGFAEDSRLLHDVAELSLGEDAPRWAALCERAGGGPPARLDGADLDAIERSVAGFSRIRPKLEAWRRACLARRGIFERLEALRAVRRADARNPALGAMLRELETEALRRAPEILEEAESLGDIETLASARRQFREGRWTRAIPEAIAGAASAAYERTVRAASAAELDDLEQRIHAAAGSMDEAALTSLRGEWEAALRRMEIGEDPELDRRVHESFAWLDARAAQRAEAEAFAEACDRLERVLDEDRPVAEIERAYAASTRFDRPLAQAVEHRVAARFAAERDSRRRRARLVSTIVVAAAIVAAATGLYALSKGIERRRLDGLAERLESLLANGQVPEARSLVGQLPPGRNARLISAVARTETEGARWDAQRDDVGARLREAAAILDRPEVMIDERAMVAARGALDGAAPAAASVEERSELARLEAIHQELSARRVEARRTAAREAWSALRAELAARVPPSRWSNAERTSVRRWDEHRGETARLRGQLAALAIEAGPAEAAEIGVELRRIDGELASIDARTAAMHRARDLLDFLDDPPPDEDAYAARILEDLAAVGEVLAEIGRLSAIERVADAARSGRAVRHWREVVRPRELRTRALESGSQGPWRPPTRIAALELAAVLALHEQTHPDSPYQRPAATMRGFLEHHAGDGSATRGDALVEAIRALGFEDLHRTPLKGGGAIYVRPGAGPFDKALSTKSDLRRPAGQLSPRGDPGLVPAGPSVPVLASVALADGLPALFGRSGIELMEAFLGLVESVERAAPEDPLLATDLLAQLWQAWRDVAATAADPLLAAMEPWLRTLQGRWREALIFDWAGRSNDLRSGPAAAARSAAESALAGLPAPQPRRAALGRWWAGLMDDLAACSPAGALLFADADGIRRTPEFSGAGEGFIIVPRPGERGRFMFAPVRIVDGEGLVEAGAAPPEATMLFRRLGQ